MWWAKRRHKHEHKNMHWIVGKYFGTRGNQHWRFFGDNTGKNGQSVRYWIAKAAHTPIQRHTKVVATANPYSPDDYDYFNRRRKKHMVKEPDSDNPSMQMSFTFEYRPPRPVWGV